MSGQLVVDSVGKSYRTYRSEWLRVLGWFGKQSTWSADHWVIRGVSFRVEPGEAVGLIGQNGAGKSTLLKIITGTLRPTEGAVHVSGRVNAILELGMGFNPELSSRQNALQSAGMMGFSEQQALERMSDIESFAEIGQYFDEPMRKLSSGMMVRVAFAVTTAWRPDLLIIDEALSVGDAYFQVKSFSRIRKFKEQGSSLLLVSHDLASIKAICERVIVIDNGRVLADGPAAQMCDLYDARTTNRISASEVRQSEASASASASSSGLVTVTRSGSRAVAVDRVTLARASDPDNGIETVAVGESVVLQISLSANARVPRIVQGFLLRDRRGNDIYGTNTFHLAHEIGPLDDSRRCAVRFYFPMNLGAGTYAVSVATVDSDTILHEKFDWIENVLVFTVTNHLVEFSIGSAWLPVTVEHELLEVQTEKAP